MLVYGLVIDRMFIDLYLSFRERSLIIKRVFRLKFLKGIERFKSFLNRVWSMIIEIRVNV